MHDTRVYCAWFAGGLRVVDVADPSAPEEVGYYIPEPARGRADEIRRDDQQCVGAGFLGGLGHPNRVGVILRAGNVPWPPEIKAALGAREAAVPVLAAFIPELHSYDGLIAEPAMEVSA